MSLDPFSLNWILAFLCISMVGFTKSGIAGLGILAVPVMANLFPAGPSTGVLLPLLVAGDLMAVRNYRGHVAWQHVGRALPWAGVGIVLAWVYLKYAPPPDHILRIGLGFLVLAMLGFGVWMQRRGKERLTASLTESEVPLSLTAFIGIVGGFCTMAANAAGPIFVVYLLMLGLVKHEFNGTRAWIFLVLNSVKLPFSYSLGYINANSLYIDLTLLPAIPMGAWLGYRCVNRISQLRFTQVVRFLTLLAALDLIFNVTGWLKTLFTAT